ncbi:glycoside hydrolase family 19 protein [Chitinivorax sp. PXF-14]|uniref:glycoside hydrolase family 19 protein n=1 Tax=Chitinivorax sp. PXF-14 TaxID=3230488 RepID=UPI0034670A9B
MPAVTSSLIQAIMPKCRAPDTWATALDQACSQFQINTPQRLAAFLAQVAHESGELNRLEESLNYSAQRLTQVWPKRFPSLAAAQPYAGNPQRLANFVYANRIGNRDEGSGDGYRYRGRGLIQLTGRANYQAVGQAIGRDLLNQPDDLLTPDGASQSAAYFWKSHLLNELADMNAGDDETEDFKTISIKINGGVAGLPQRQAYWQTARKALGI